MSEDTTIKPDYNEWAAKAVKIVAKMSMTQTGHRVVGTPHILMGVLKEGPAANLLTRSFGVNKTLVAQIIEAMPKPLPKGLGEDFLYTDGAREVLAKAQQLAIEYGFRHGQIYTDHLLAALLLINDKSFAYVMSSLVIDHDALLVQAMKALQEKRELAKV